MTKNIWPKPKIFGQNVFKLGFFKVESETSIRVLENAHLEIFKHAYKTTLKCLLVKKKNQ